VGVVVGSGGGRGAGEEPSSTTADAAEDPLVDGAGEVLPGTEGSNGVSGEGGGEGEPSPSTAVNPANVTSPTGEGGSLVSASAGEGARSTSYRPAEAGAGARASGAIAVDGVRGVPGTVCQAISDFDASEEGVVAEPDTAVGAGVVAVGLVSWGGGVEGRTGAVVGVEIRPRSAEGAVGAVPIGGVDTGTGPGGARDFGVGSPRPGVMLPRRPRLDRWKVRGGRAGVEAPPFFRGVGRSVLIVRGQQVGRGADF